jgi:pimeloyl-ACP methyl ester carboxylesterase
VTPDDISQVMRTRDGRTLAYLQVGNPDGPLVLHNHGGPSSRMPGAVWHPVEGAGHFVAVGAADDIFRITADELGAH